MSFKTVLSVLGVNQSDADLTAAIALCQEIDAHLSVLAMALAAPPPIGEYAAIVSEAWLEERQTDLRRLEERVGHVTEAIARSGVSADVASEYAERAWADEAIGQRARYADLAVIGSELSASSDLGSYVLDGTLYEAGRPALILPKAAKATLRPRNVMVAWDSNPEAARAVRESLEILSAAKNVCVAMVDPQTSDRASGPEPGADIAAYLARHGAKVTVDRLPSGGQSIAEVLRQHAADISAEMIVMGAYGHSRLRQRVLGGVTRSMIDEPPLPLFLAR